MKKPHFDKPFTQQETIPEDAITAAVNVMKTGRLHRYNIVEGEDSEVNLLEEEYAAYQGVKYCLAASSGGGAMQIALRAIGVKPGDKVATNAFTLAPVPGAIAAVGASPIYIESNENLTIDLEDLKYRLMASGARYLLLSHMRGHIAPMEQIVKLLDDLGVKMIEDCAHTMGAEWNGIKSGNFGAISCFSTQTYKHINSGEGGFLTTNDDELMARAIILSGSYMLYEKHKARPDMKAFEQARFEMPNCSSRMDNLRAAILRPQLAQLELNIARWNIRYQILEKALSQVSGIDLPKRPEEELYVGSSIQFSIPEWSDIQIRQFMENCKGRGVELKWFGDANPVGFTSRYDSWRYALAPKLDRTLKILHRLIDMRIPLSFDEDDCALIAQIIEEEFKKINT